MLTVLVVDDELPAVRELAYLLGKDGRIGTVHTAGSGAEALLALEREDIDAIFLDIHMPGLSGLDLARVIARFARPPAVVFVTADEEHALEAFDLAAVDYLLKPVGSERLSRCVGRIVALQEESRPAPQEPAPELITVEQAGVTRRIRREDVRFVQAQGDYARLHTVDGSYLVRVPLNDLERQWAPAGFVRVHRSFLVAMANVEQLRLGGAHASVVVAGVELPVSRRLLPGLRERLAATRIRPLP
ncbi:LytTR family DNA-binding domain-containing protein [Sinomonas sp. ASV322]|uniref:LytR/AlgR family response regulator transcription factor n=1 Tax=Sinomonas sp. ASV322 TaxID=3041920 RepID=UPI0027DD7EF1|nr:LytTR family DNA-binding domain-containing protein [Sinomonas sp. ASV322]MDQ4502760.1 LytTR family DNA-binding domain-containing protein [Sinomonas sp. ASV322]